MQRVTRLIFPFPIPTYAETLRYEQFRRWFVFVFVRIHRLGGALITSKMTPAKETIQ